MKILVHHHTKPYVSDKGIHIQSFIGTWVLELSKYFTEIGLLVSTSQNLLEEHDVLINQANIVIHDYQRSKSVFTFRRNKFLIKKCNDISSNYDVLLIRGITPRQKVVFDNCDVNKKYFLLVGSLIDSVPKLKFQKTSIIEWLFYWHRRRELKIISKAANFKFLSNSKGVVDELFDLFNEKAAFIPTNTISSNDFIVLNKKNKHKKIKILFCGRIVKEKGIEELLTALDVVSTKGIDVSLDIIGNCALDYKLKLKKIIRDLNISSSKIRFLGFIPFGKQLLDFYRNSDIFILPSWHEGFPHTVWEAGASGLPVIVTPVGGIPSLISSQDALFCNVKDYRSIVDAIIETIENPQATSNRVKSLYKLADSYNSSKCAELLYNEIIKK